MKLLRDGLALGVAAMLAACAEDARMPAGDAASVPLQTPRQARQAPIVNLDGLLHVGADVAAPAGGLPHIARHGDARVSHGSIADGVGAAELIAYLRADAAWYLNPGEETGTDDQLIPGGLVLRFAAEPPAVRVAAGTPPELLDETVRVVQAINAALPTDWQLRFGAEFVPAEATEAPDGEILVTFAPQADWPPEAAPPDGEDIGLAEPRFTIEPTGDPEAPWRIDIVAGRVWIDPAQTEGLERLGVIAHELIHLLGRGHVDPNRFPATLMVAGGSEELSPHVLHPLDREALLAVYRHLPPGTPPDRIAAELGSWSETSMHIRGAIDVAGGEIAFGAALRNGLSQPWAAGPAPGSPTRGQRGALRQRKLVRPPAGAHAEGGDRRRRGRPHRGSGLAVGRAGFLRAGALARRRGAGAGGKRDDMARRPPGLRNRGSRQRLHPDRRR